MKRRRGLVRIPITLIVVGVIVAAYYAAHNSTQAPSYRLSSAGYEVVTATISGIGTLQPTNSTTVVPPITGTIASVDVTVGETVATGQTIATITPSVSASEAVSADEAALSVAEATLTDAQQSTTTTTSTTTSSTTTTMVPASGSRSALQAAQQSYQALCTGPAADPANATACTSLQHSLQQLSTSQSSPTPTHSSSPAQQGQGGRSTTPTTISAAQITADEAAVTADQQALTLAQQDVAGTVTSPASGVVAAISMTTGSPVRTQSTKRTITIIDPSSIEVVLPVPTSESTAIHAGNDVTVRLEGRSQTYHAKVISIGTTPTTSQSTGVTTVPVTALLNTKAIANFDGALADTTITTAQLSRALSVPTSALSDAAGHYTVTVMKSGTPTQVSVKVGTIGATWTAITSGLTNGEQVVLANLNKPLPTAQSTFGAGAARKFRARFRISRAVAKRLRAAGGGFAGAAAAVGG